MEWHYNEDRRRIVLDKLPKRHKRITGHRFPSILGLNKYQTEFGAWCEIVGLVRLPFEDNKYTIAGKTIEPKQIEYAKEFFPNIMSTEEYYGNSYSDYRYSNYKDLNSIYDGVRDFVSTKNDMKTIVMVGECKTSSKPQDWDNNNVPMDYLCQGMLYTYLDKLDSMVYVVSFLKPEDYNHPENFTIDQSNTKFVVKRLKDCFIELPHEEPTTKTVIGDWTTQDIRFGSIQDAIEYGDRWWKTYVDTGISPEFDEVKDKEYLDIIRASQPSNDNDLITLCNEGIELAKEIKELEITSGLKNKKNELKLIETAIKSKMIENQDECCGGYKLSMKMKNVFDEETFAEKEEKLYNKYITQKIEYKLSKDLKEEGDD